MQTVRARITFVIGAVLLGLCACSSIRVSYNYLDWIIGWQLDDYLSLNSPQQHWYEGRLEALLQWHRGTQLLRYRRFAARLQKDLRRPLNEALLQAHASTLRGFWHDIATRMAPDCAGLLLQLDRQQRQDLYAALEEKQQEHQRRYAEETEVQRRRRHCRLAAKVLDRFVGHLTGGQRVILEQWASELVPLQDLWLENRRTWLAWLQEVLEGPAPGAEKRARLERLFARPEQLRSPAYSRALSHNEAVTHDMVIKVQASLLPGQRRHLQDTLTRLQQDFSALARSGTAVPSP